MARQYYPKKPLGDKWSSLNEWQSYLEHFHDVSPGIADQTKRNYQEAKQYYFNLANSSLYKKFLQELNYKNTDFNLSLDNTINSIINKIQNEGNLWKFIQGQKQGFKINQAQAQTLLQGWNNIISLIKTKNWAGINNSLIRLESLAESLQKQIDQNTDFIDLTQIIPTKSGKASSVANSIQGTLNIIRGAALEEEAKKFIAKRLPNDIIYRTGNINVNGLQIKADLLALFDDIEITNTNGEVVYIFKNGNIYLKDGITAVETVSLTEDQLSTLQEMALGFSAKTSQTSTVFHGGQNIAALLGEESADGDQKVFQLIHMYQLGIGKNHTDFQKYVLSKRITSIIGKKEAFLITRNNIYPTYKYIEQLIGSPFKFSNSKLPARSENAPLNREFGSTNITGKSPGKL